MACLSPLTLALRTTPLIVAIMPGTAPATDRSTASTRDRRLSRAAALQKREQLRNSVANRIQRLYRKNPATARELADKVLALVKGTPREKNLNEEELRSLLREAAGQGAKGAGASGSSSGKRGAKEQPATAASAIGGGDAAANGGSAGLASANATARMYSTTTSRQFDNVATAYKAKGKTLNIMPQVRIARHRLVARPRCASPPCPAREAATEDNQPTTTTTYATLQTLGVF